MKTIQIASIALMAFGLVLAGAGPIEAQKRGQWASIQHGVVVKVETVDLSDNKTTKGAKVVTDQTEIHMGDCVVIEDTSQGTNIRRVNSEVDRALMKVDILCKG